jgi:aromatic ring-opening dioxygenase LigB subunit
MLYLQNAGYRGALVPVTYTGFLEYDNEWRFGQAIARAAARSSKSLAVVASSDLSHVHNQDGPYGFDPISSEFDATIERAVRANDLRSLLTLDPAWVQKAAQDGLRSILILGGSIEGLNFVPADVAYEVRDYYGMVTATFSPTSESRAALAH